MGRRGRSVRTRQGMLLGWPPPDAAASRPRSCLARFSRTPVPPCTHPPIRTHAPAHPAEAAACVPACPHAIASSLHGMHASASAAFTHDGGGVRHRLALHPPPCCWRRCCALRRPGNSAPAPTSATSATCARPASDSSSSRCVRRGWGLLRSRFPGAGGLRFSGSRYRGGFHAFWAQCAVCRALCAPRLAQVCSGFRGVAGFA